MSLEQNQGEWLTKLVLSSDVTAEECQNLNQIIKTKKHEYHLTSLLAKGEISDVFEAYYDENEQRKQVVIKLVRNPKDNDLAINEIRILRSLYFKEDPNMIHLALLVDQFKTSNGSFGIILNRFNGYNLDQVRTFPSNRSGVDPYEVAWMMSRMLGAIGYAHTKGVIHCNIEPAHVLIEPINHNAAIIDWSYASTNGSPFKAINEDYSPPEVVLGQTPLSSSDLYSIGKCTIFLLGGNLADNNIPEYVDMCFQNFIRYFLLPSPNQRARNAWEMLHKLEDLRVEIWGEKVFRPCKWQ